MKASKSDESYDEDSVGRGGKNWISDKSHKRQR